MKIPSDIIEANRDLSASWFREDGNDDRIEVINATAELEATALDALKRFVVEVSGRFSEDQAAAAMSDAGYDDGTSLKQLAKLLYMLGRIDRDLRDDLCTLYKIRNVYAHRAKAGQLDEESDLEVMVKNMECYKQTRSALDALPTIRHIYRAIAAHLRRELAKVAS